MSIDKDSAIRLYKNTQETLDSIGKEIESCGYDGALARGQMAELVGYFDDAINAYKEAIALKGTSELAECRLALAQIKAGQFEEALNTASRVAAKAPKFTVKALASDDEVPALTILGDALAVNQRFDDAIAAYEALSGKSGKSGLDGYTAGRLAQLYLATGKPEQALPLKESIKDSVRFSSLQEVLSLGETSISLLPSFDIGTLANSIANEVHGRPLIINNEIKTAKIVEEDTGWCS